MRLAVTVWTIFGCACASSSPRGVWFERKEQAERLLSGDFDGAHFWHEVMVARSAASAIAGMTPDPVQRCERAGAMRTRCEERVRRERAPEHVVAPLRTRLYEVLDQLGRRCVTSWKEAVRLRNPATAAAYATLWRMLRNEVPLSLPEALVSGDVMTRYLATFTLSEVPILARAGGFDLGPLARYGRIEAGDSVVLRRELASRGVAVAEVEVSSAGSAEHVRVERTHEVESRPDLPRKKELEERHAAVSRSGERCTGGPTEWSTEDTRWVMELDRHSPYYGTDRLTTTRRTYTFDSPRVCSQTPEAAAELARLEVALREGQYREAHERVVVKTREVKEQVALVLVEVQYGSERGQAIVPPDKAEGFLLSWLEERRPGRARRATERGWDRYARRFPERPNDDLVAFLEQEFPLVLPPDRSDEPKLDSPGQVR